MSGRVGGMAGHFGGVKNHQPKPQPIYQYSDWPYLNSVTML